MKARHWWMIVGNVAVIGSALWTRGLLQIVCLSILLAIYTAEYIELCIKLNKLATSRPFNKAYMDGVQVGMRIGYAQRMMEEKGDIEKNENV